MQRLVVSCAVRHTYIYICVCVCVCFVRRQRVNPLNAELNPICYLLALVGAHHILHFSRVRIKDQSKDTEHICTFSSVVKYILSDRICCQ